MSVIAKVAVSTASALQQALAQGVREIMIQSALADLPPIALSVGQHLVGAPGASLHFSGDGIGLSANNSVRDMALVAPRAACAIRLTPGFSERGRLLLDNLDCTGRVQLIFDSQTQGGALALQRFALLDADASGQTERPSGNGVEVLQGGVTIWNQAAGDVTIDVHIDGLTIGSHDRPVGGTGLFIAGASDGRKGKIAIGEMRIGDVFADSQLPFGTTATVSGGVFILPGATVETIQQIGSCMTRGANAVPVDNWGRIDAWRISGDAISHGPSAIGFINAGTLQELHIDGVIETFGDGARGCGIYGPTGRLQAVAIRTHGAAAVGVQILDRLQTLRVSEGIFTEGAPGEGLVKGVMAEMPAHAIHIEHGGRLERLEAPRTIASGPGAQPICNEGFLGE